MEAGLPRQRVFAKTRPCRVEGEPLKRVAAYVETFRTFWEESFFDFQQITSLDQLVFVTSICSEKGESIKHPA